MFLMYSESGSLTCGNSNTLDFGDHFREMAEMVSWVFGATVSRKFLLLAKCSFTF